MTEIIGTIRNFIYRDLLYIIGGGSVLLSFLYLFDKLAILETIPTAIWLFGAGLAYALGYAVQDGMSLTPIITTAHLTQPGCIVKFLYEIFTHYEWQDFDSAFDAHQAYITVMAHSPQEPLNEIIRIISLKHIGTTIGSSGLCCTVLLSIKAVITGTAFDITLAAGVFMISVVLSILGWIKGAEQTQYVRSLLPIAESIRDTEREVAKLKE